MQARQEEEREKLFERLRGYIRQGRLDELEAALREGFPAGYRSEKFPDWSLLECACAAGSPRALFILLKHGLDVNSVDSKGCSALHYSCKFGNVPCAKVLIIAGADAGMADKEGNTPIDLVADEKAKEEIRGWLILEKERGLARRGAGGDGEDASAPDFDYSLSLYADEFFCCL